jgi:hypothetical protein
MDVENGNVGFDAHFLYLTETRGVFLAVMVAQGDVYSASKVILVNRLCVLGSVVQRCVDAGTLVQIQGYTREAVTPKTRALILSSESELFPGFVLPKRE